MLAKMTWRQFCSWVVYASLEPFGEERADYRSCIVASTVANFTPGVKRRYKASDFMPEFDATPAVRKPITDPAVFEAMKQRAIAFANAS